MRVLGYVLLAALGLAVPQVSAQTAPNVTLTRLECGTPPAPIDVNARFSDTLAYKNLMLQFVFSCYLIKHGNEYMLRDTYRATEVARREGHLADGRVGALDVRSGNRTLWLGASC